MGGQHCKLADTCPGTRGSYCFCVVESQCSTVSIGPSSKGDHCKTEPADWECTFQIIFDVWSIILYVFVALAGLTLLILLLRKLQQRYKPEYHIKCSVWGIDLHRCVGATFAASWTISAMSAILVGIAAGVAESRTHTPDASCLTPGERAGTVFGMIVAALITMCCVGGAFSYLFITLRSGIQPQPQPQPQQPPPQQVGEDLLAEPEEGSSVPAGIHLAVIPPEGSASEPLPPVN